VVTPYFRNTVARVNNRISPTGTRNVRGYARGVIDEHAVQFGICTPDWLLAGSAPPVMNTSLVGRMTATCLILRRSS
jgi:hypothetical protein